MLQYEADLHHLAVRVQMTGLKLPLGVLWNVDLQLVCCCCCCALRRAFSAEGEEGVGQAAAHAASRRKQFG